MGLLKAPQSGWFKTFSFGKGFYNPVLRALVKIYGQSLVLMVILSLPYMTSEEIKFRSLLGSKSNTVSQLGLDHPGFSLTQFFSLRLFISSFRKTERDRIPNRVLTSHLPAAATGLRPWANVCLAYSGSSPDLNWEPFHVGKSFVPYHFHRCLTLHLYYQAGIFEPWIKNSLLVQNSV